MASKDNVFVRMNEECEWIWNKWTSHILKCCRNIVSGGNADICILACRKDWTT